MAVTVAIDFSRFFQRSWQTLANVSFWLSFPIVGSGWAILNYRYATLVVREEIFSSDKSYNILEYLYKTKDQILRAELHRNIGLIGGCCLLSFILVQKLSESESSQQEKENQE